MKVNMQNVSHNRGELKLLRNVSFTVESGESIVISAPSGNGKSLLFSILSGLTKPDKGRVLVDEQMIYSMNQQQNQYFRKCFSTIFQRPALISNLSLIENFLLPLNLHYPYLSKEEKLAKINHLTELVGITDFLPQRTEALSVGQAALAGFVRGMLLEPKCLIWDAPLVEIDQRYEDVVKSLLSDLRSAGSTIILLSNRDELIVEFATRHFILSEGILRQHDVK